MSKRSREEVATHGLCDVHDFVFDRDFISYFFSSDSKSKPSLAFNYEKSKDFYGSPVYTFSHLKFQLVNTPENKRVKLERDLGSNYVPPHFSEFTAPANCDFPSGDNNVNLPPPIFMERPVIPLPEETAKEKKKRRRKIRRKPPQISNRVDKRQRMHCAHCKTDFWAKPTCRDGRYVLNHKCTNIPRRQYVVGGWHRKCSLNHYAPCVDFVAEGDEQDD